VSKRLAAGANTVAWNGKIARRKARAGRYRLALSAAARASTTAEAALRLR
jgi:hypothetical protein